MAKTFEAKYYQGNINSNVGSWTGAVIGGQLVETDKGKAFRTGESKYISYGSSILPAGAFTVVVWAKLSSSHVVGTDRFSMFAGNTTGSLNQRFLTSVGGGIITLECGGNNYRTWAYTPNKLWHCYIVYLPGSGQTDITNSTLYVDNVMITVNATVSTVGQDARTNSYYVGSCNNATSGGDIAYLAVHDTALTPGQYAEEYAKFVRATQTSSQTFGFTYPKPIEINKSGLLASWDFSQVVGGVVPDLSNTGNNVTTISKCARENTGLRFNATDSYCSLTGSSGLTGDITVCVRVYVNGWGESNVGTILNNAQLGLIVASSSSYLIFTRDNSTITNPASNSISIGKWYNITITSTSAGVTNFYIDAVASGTANQAAGTPASSTAWYIGNRAANDRTFDGIIQEIQIYNRILSTLEIKQWNNKWASQIVKRYDFSDVGIGNVPKDFLKISGTWAVAEQTSDDVNVRAMKKGVKYLLCSSSGVISTPSKQTYGTFSQVMYKDADANVSDWLFIATTTGNATTAPQNGYLVRFGSDEKFYLYKTTNGVLSAALITSASTYSLSTYYQVEVRRTQVGGFTLLINGTSVGTATDTSFTSSNFTTWDYDTNDRCALIKYKQGIEQI